MPAECERLIMLVIVGTEFQERCRNGIQITNGVRRLSEEFINLISGNTSEG